MPFNYLACSIKGTAFSEYSSLLLITREMNSLPGGVSLPNANPLPKHTLHLGPPSNPLPGPCPCPGPGLSSAHCGCGRHVNRPSGAGDTSATALAPALRSPPRGPAPWTRPATHPLACSTRRRPNFLPGRTFRASHRARSGGGGKHGGGA